MTIDPADDPRTQPGAYVSRPGAQKGELVDVLYYITKRRQVPAGNTTYVDCELEDCYSGKIRTYAFSSVTKLFVLQRIAPKLEVPDAIPPVLLIDV